MNEILDKINDLIRVIELTQDKVGLETAREIQATLVNFLEPVDMNDLPVRSTGKWIDSRFGDNWYEMAKTNFTLGELCHALVYNGRKRIMLEEQIKEMLRLGNMKEMGE